MAGAVFNNGEDVLGKHNQNFQRKKPLLVTHEDQDTAINQRGTIEFSNKIDAKNKTLVIFPKLLHNPPQEPLGHRIKAPYTVIGYARVLFSVTVEQVTDTGLLLAAIVGSCSVPSNMLKSVDGALKSLWTSPLSYSRPRSLRPLSTLVHLPLERTTFFAFLRIPHIIPLA